MPDELEAKVKAKLKENPDITWHRAVRLLVDPDAPDDEDDDRVTPELANDLTDVE